MYIDRDRQLKLEREKADAEANIQKLLSEAGGGAGGADALRVLRERVQSIEDELNRMEFATELERQSDA